jgi:dTDP-4-dehydrorhamnose reductase
MPELPRILVLGATGQVGWELCRSLCVIGRILPLSRNGKGHLHADLQDLAALPALLDELAPDVIVNAAAYTAVDRAETERAQAFNLNARLPEAIGQWAARRGAMVIHYSTDYVFDGTQQAPYTEEDRPNPINVYGESKWDGDQALLASGADTWILRVGWVYGLRGHNFLRTMQRLMAERDHLRIVDDQVGAPTWCRSIAEATLALLSQLLRQRDALRHTAGTYHLAPAGEVSWYGFASAIGRFSDLGCALDAISTADYPTAARRPLNSRMSAGLLRETFRIGLPAWDVTLQDCLGEDGP